MIDRLLRVFGGANLDVTSEDLADALWLAHVLPKGALAGDHPTVEPESEGDTDWNGETPDAPPPLAPPARHLGSAPPSPVLLLSSNASREQVPALPIRVPTGAALPHSLALGRALRPLRRRVPSRTQKVLDEVASVEFIADTGVWAPILRPGSMRWLDLALVVDTSSSMNLWRQTVAEFQELLRFQGAFRNVRTWSLSTDEKEGPLRLVSGMQAGSPLLQVTEPQELNDPGGRQLVMVLSDCVGPRWHSGDVFKLLEDWGRSGPAIVVQLLPEQFWNRTALRHGSTVLLRASRSGLPNSQLQVSRRSRRPPPSARVQAVPVVHLEPAALGEWANMLAGGTASPLGFEFRGARPSPEGPVETGATPTARELVQHFHATASAPARKMMGLLAAVPVSLPVMRLIRETLVPDARQEHLAEVFLGGLLQELPGQEAQGDPDAREYDFKPGVRELLLDAVPVGSARAVLLQVSEYIAKRMDQSRDFAALLLDPTKDATAFVMQNRRFATLARSVLQRMGGAYAQLAQRLEPKQVAPGWGRVHLTFHPAYHGLEANILGRHAQVTAVAHITNAPWSLELPYGDYRLELPQLHRNHELTVGTEPVSFRLDWALTGKRVLVAGTSKNKLSSEEAWTSDMLGDLLARSGHGLVTGGQKGVDSRVGHAYLARLRAAGLRHSNSLVQVITASSRPEIAEGTIVRVPKGVPDINEEVRHADAAVLIGGKLGTFKVYQRARAAQVPVIPLGSTGGVASEVFEESQNGIYRTASDTLGILRKPIRNRTDANLVAEEAIAVLHDLFGTKRLDRWSWLPADTASQLRLISQQYDQARAEQPAGAARTRLMNELVDRVITETDALPPIPLKRFEETFDGAGAGDRIVLLGLMLSEAQFPSFTVMHGILSNALTPFEQYKALELTGQMLEHLSSEQVDELRGTLSHLRNTNALQINDDESRRRQLVGYLVELERLSAEAEDDSSAEDEFDSFNMGLTDEASDSVDGVEALELEELAHRVRNQYFDIERGITERLPDILTGHDFKQDHSLQAGIAGTIASVGSVRQIRLQMGDLRRTSASSASITATCIVDGVRIDWVAPSPVEDTSALRSFHVRVEVHLELEHSDDAPPIIEGVFTNHVLSLELMDLEEKQDDEFFPLAAAHPPKPSGDPVKELRQRLRAQDSTPLTVFYSYSDEDSELRDDLEQHLSEVESLHLRPSYDFETEGVSDGWSDVLGSPWSEQRLSDMADADVLLLLLSPHFLASEQCVEVELTQALEQQESQVSLVIPIILSPCDWEHTPLGKLLVLPTDGRPVTSWRNQDEALDDIAHGIERAIKRWRQQG
ncbi:TIR domain-containing protein [Corallococcus sp. AB049A]|uniref:SAV_2336 N-terminal domain-related protein n=1 Tax=Corallococcus sp. AB049A TaxID=2316721 RepID=UPI000ED95D7B|nr:SAV_2336 N-terminal domain-related protein [Corallococcus sp. AB049A]RKI72897.1 TIR domain-containing protein [Corallococcus sp. AB049A]